ncbi:hypothetical protein DXG03_005091 [Asterophora parasitica]|uniref:DUF3533 domain-containing protein n=1 Tax=Asterophora parasitica TaxID=117018 RepID=A0A9P7G2A8_9AGAR|nr:hypothetical protein DXG03_005091 [Asterophora parasitica]
MSTQSTQVDVDLEPTTSAESSTRAPSPQPQSDAHDGGFFDARNAAARAIYFKTIFRGLFLIIILIFTVFPIFWGALWKTPVRKLQGWVIDFDGGEVGQSVVQALTSPEVGGMGKINWSVIPASRFPKGVKDVGDALVEQHAWAAITINSGSSARLNASYISPNASYDGSEAITVHAVEARSENTYRILTAPSAQAVLNKICQSFALRAGAQIQATSNLPALLSTSPQTIVTPIWYTLNNLRPFNQPVYVPCFF